MSTTIKPGNWVRIKGTFLKGDGTVLAAGTVTIGHVSLRYRSSKSATDVDVSGASANVSTGISVNTDPDPDTGLVPDNSFKCDVYVPDATPKSIWEFRWEDSQHGIAIESSNPSSLGPQTTDLKLIIDPSYLATP